MKEKLGKRVRREGEEEMNNLILSRRLFLKSAIVTTSAAIVSCSSIMKINPLNPIRIIDIKIKPASGDPLNWALIHAQDIEKAIFYGYKFNDFTCYEGSRLVTINHELFS